MQDMQARPSAGMRPFGLICKHQDLCMSARLAPGPLRQVRATRRLR